MPTARERGSVILLVLFVLVVVGLLTAGLLTLALTARRTADSLVAESQAEACAEGGLDRAMVSAVRSDSLTLATADSIAFGRLELGPGQSTTTRAVRLGRGLWLLRSEGTVESIPGRILARSALGRLVRLAEGQVPHPIAAAGWIWLPP
jgi:hypothetical protein